MNVIEISSGKKYVFSLIAAIISIGSFIYGTYNSVIVITNMSIPAYRLILPMIFFICGFIGTMISFNCMTAYGEQWSFDEE